MAKGITVRFENLQQYLDTLELLDAEGYLGDEVGYGTSLSSSVEKSQAFNVKEVYKGIHKIEKKKINNKQYITFQFNSYWSYIDPDDKLYTGLSIGIEDRDYVKQKYPELFGKANIVANLQTKYDDKVGDVYKTLVSPEDVLIEVEKMAYPLSYLRNKKINQIIDG